MNDAPAVRQSRGTARPQAGESTFPHQIIQSKGWMIFYMRETINLMINIKLTRILLTTGIIAQVFYIVKGFNKILVKII